MLWKLSFLNFIIGEFFYFLIKKFRKKYNYFCKLGIQSKNLFYLKLFYIIINFKQISIN